ncbi:hypothetical protein [Microbulbifer sp. JSM ZJ756]|uniref:hypothetical protein n=1 Tax=Microbulbifer sp. JSM ZJ756 TaxID=3376191 RepID=UPI0037934F0F
MINITEIDVVPLKDIAMNFPSVDFRSLLKSAISGDVSLYMFIEPGEILDRHPQFGDWLHATLNLPDINGYVSNTTLSVWPLTDDFRYGPAIIQIDPINARSIAKDLHYHLTMQGFEQCCATTIDTSVIQLLDSDGLPVIRACSPTDNTGRPFTKNEIESAIQYSNFAEPTRRQAVDQYVIRKEGSIIAGNLAVSEKCILSFIQASKTATPGFKSGIPEHWGEGLRMLVMAANQFWDPDEVAPGREETYPYNVDVVKYFEDLGYKDRIAKEFAKCIRPDWATARRKKKAE